MYEKIREKWYAKLRASGFDDIEWSSKALGVSGPYLKGPNRVAYYRGLRYGIDEYYRLAGWYMHDNDEWPTEQERQMWAWHAEGVRNVEISSRIGQSRASVSRTLKRHRERMKQMYVGRG